MSVVYNLPVACNRSTADFVISSRLFEEEYETIIKDYTTQIGRQG
jgi:methylglyoxal synthase